MYFNVLNNFSSMQFFDWKPLKVGNWPRFCFCNLLKKKRQNERSDMCEAHDFWKKWTPCARFLAEN